MLAEQAGKEARGSRRPRRNLEADSEEEMSSGSTTDADVEVVTEEDSEDLEPSSGELHCRH